MSTFFVLGVVRTKGSTRSFLNRRGRIQTVSDNDGLATWEKTVMWTARQAGVRAIEGPAEIGFTAFIPRPKSHYGRRGTLLPSAPIYPIEKNRNDIDKIERALLDGLTGVAWENDSQVVRVTKDKVYCHAGQPDPGVSITLGAAPAGSARPGRRRA